MKKDQLGALEVKNADTVLKKATKKNPAGTVLKLVKLHDGMGLYLWVYETGEKYWRMRYWIGGKERSLSLGVYPKVSLADARKKRDELHKQLDAGQDPNQEKKTKKIAEKLAVENSFELVAREWYGRQVKTWVHSHSVDVKRRLEADLFPTLGARPISKIDAQELLACVRKIESRGAHDLAHRVLQVAGQVFRYGIATGKCQRDWSRDLKGALTPAIKKNQPAVDLKELPALLRSISTYDQPPIEGDRQTKLGLWLMALTFVRTNELIGATWPEFDLDHALWTIPASRMKMKRPHTIPLAPQTLVVLKELKALAGDSAYVLPGRSALKSISSNTLLFGLYRLGWRGKMSGHGFRSTASTTLYESNLFEPNWVEFQLAHAPANAVMSSYNKAQYLPHRREMMIWYANHLDTLVGGDLFNPKLLKSKTSPPHA
jgi:integrase